MAKRFNIEGEYRNDDSLTNDYGEQVTIPPKYQPQTFKKVSHANGKVNELNEVVQERNEKQMLKRRKKDLGRNKPDYSQDRKEKRETQNFWIGVHTGENEIEMGDK